MMPVKHMPVAWRPRSTYRSRSPKLKFFALTLESEEYDSPQEELEIPFPPGRRNLNIPWTPL